MNTFVKQFREAKAQHKRQFHARLRHLSEDVSSVNLLIVETALIGQAHKLAPAANSYFAVAAADMHIVTIQSADKLREKLFGHRTAKTLPQNLNEDQDSLSAFQNKSCVLSLFARHCPSMFALHISIVKGRGTCSKSVNFDDSSTTLHDVEYYCFMNCIIFWKYQEYVFL